LTTDSKGQLPCNVISRYSS